MTDKTDAMSVVNDTDVNFPFCNVSDNHEADLFLRIKEVGDPQRSAT